MKKFIATAALVAASTALASAATVVFSFNADVAGATKVAADNQTGALSQSLDALNSGATMKIEYSSGKWWSQTVATSSLGTDAVNALAKNTGLTTTAISGITAGAGSGAGGNTLTFTLSGLKGETEYVISTILKPQSGAGTISLTSGTLIDGAYGSSTWTTVSTLSDVSLTNNTVTAVTFTVKTTESGELKFTANQKAAVALLGITAIPEPSAFGLLAGIGALALAVSRRKRSRR